MILICSDANEPSTDIVCSWLHYYNKKFLRISHEDIIDIKRITINNNDIDIEFYINHDLYKISDFTSYWYRRSTLTFRTNSKIELWKEGVDISKEASTFLKKEESKIFNFFEIKLHELSKLNTYNDNAINKLNTLYQAQKLGIKIPDTIISDSFEKSLFDKNKWITKPISDMIILKDGNYYASSTKRVSFDDVENIGMSQMQTEVNKKFEIRSFYFDKTFYSSVIFSQGNPKTELDFRNYDDENPNRVVPYKLPDELEGKLIELAETLNLKSGSFDIAYTHEKEYVLFEINPVGQFEQVTFPCNYQIHKKIAQFL